MSVTLIGTDHDQVLKFRGSSWWAEGGLIHCQKDDGETSSQTVKETLERLHALNTMIGNSRADRGIAQHSDAFREHQNYVEQMIQLCKKAQDQGRPDVPEHIAQMRRDGKLGSRLVIVPGFGTQM